jgi:3'(2'), 5'-bisphosphate nucleotidase
MKMNENLQDTLAKLVDISKRAGLAILAWYDRDMGITRKADESPLTRADLASHELIVAELAANWPDIPVLSEESADIPWQTRQQWRQYWLVDPLDGTKEFISRNGEFTVNIALIRDHRPVIGVVHVPVTDTSYFGTLETGARLQQGDSEPVAIRVAQPAERPYTIVGSRSHANPGLAGQLAQLGPHQLVSMGSSLKFCHVAEGKADFYPRLGPTCEWDTAAAQGVVEAAGGKVVKSNGSPLDYNRKETYLNPHFFVFGDPEPDWLRPFRRTD